MVVTCPQGSRGNVPMTEKQFDKLVQSIMREAEKEGEPVTRAEAEEIAKLEIKAKANSNRVESEEKKKPKPKPKKKDPEKIEIIKKVFNFLLTNGFEDATIVNEQREITFGDYSVTLIKHRKEKKA